MSANDGGDPIQLSRAPVPKPVIPRGRTSVPKMTLSAVPLLGEAATFFWRREDADLTFHNVRAIDETATDIVFDVTPYTVVTWDVAPNPN
jgi:hypothetical protein